MIFIVVYRFRMTQDDGCIEYMDVLNALNWRELPVAKPTASADYDDSEFGSTRHTDDRDMLDKTTHERKKFNVDYSGMLKDLGLNMSFPISSM
jgi:hypothetical protein